MFYVDLSPMEAKELIDNTTGIIIDVSPFYAQGNILVAINYYSGDSSLDEVIPTLDKTNFIISIKSYEQYIYIDKIPCFM